MKNNITNINLSPNWVTGFSDAESSFIISIFKSNSHKSGWQVYPVFSIGLHIKDILLLNSIKDFFGVGTVIKRDLNLRPTAVYSVKSIKDINNVIIPHFLNYPLLTQKRSDFELFKLVLDLMASGDHLTPEGFNKILSIKSSINNGLSAELKTKFPNVKSFARPDFSLPDFIHPEWVVGFADGESNFDIRIYKSKNSILGYHARLRFRVTQHVRDLSLLTKLIEFFNCGQTVVSKKFPAANYEVSRFTDINTKIIPFFEKYPLLGIKSLDFQDFNKASKLISSGEHLTASGLEKIRSIKAGINSNRILEQ